MSDPQIINIHRRRSSIPRPISGTGRRQTSTSLALTFDISDFSPTAQIPLSTTSQRCGPPPKLSSRVLAQNRLSDHIDEPLRNEDFKNLPEHPLTRQPPWIALPSHDILNKDLPSPFVSKPRIPHSRTSTNVNGKLSSTPRVGLMRPISPQLARSQTFQNLSCFNGANQNGNSFKRDFSINGDRVVFPVRYLFGQQYITSTDICSPSS